MRKALIPLALLAAPVLAEDTPAPSPPEIVAAAPRADWVAIAASDLLVMDLAADSRGRQRRVVIQLMPAPFSQGWIGNIRKLAAAHWWDGLSINRVQDNYVVQWGDAEGEDKAKARKLLKSLQTVPESDYLVPYSPPLFTHRWGIHGRWEAIEEIVPAVAPDPDWHGFSDPYAWSFSYADGFPVAMSVGSENRAVPDKFYPGRFHVAMFSVPKQVWPVHCYGMVGVGRDMPPNTGSGAELYTVIGHAPRHLDRNIALVGRVIEGIEHLSSLPRGHGPLGFYDLAQGDERVAIVSVRIGTEVKDLPAFEYLSTESASFAAYADARANRRDPFFIRPAGGADICNIPVPVRRVK